MEPSLEDLNLSQGSIADQGPIVHLPFLISPLQTKVRGQLEGMIDNKQLQWRLIQKYQQYPYEPIAKYFRNIQYKDQNTRSVDALVKTLAYIHQKYIPKISQLFQHRITRKKQHQYQESNRSEKSNSTNLSIDKININDEREIILSFIQQRIKAIRTQYYVQGISYPQQSIKIIRLTFIIEILRQVNVTTGGLMQLIKDFTDSQFDLGEDWQDYTKGGQVRRKRQQLKVFRQRYMHIYVQALQYTIILANKNQLHSLISDHEIIMQDQTLRNTLRLRRAMDTHNFQLYQRNLQNNQNPLYQCLLWSRIESIRTSMVQRIASWNLVKKTWFYKFMGWQIKKEDQGQWIKGKTALELSNDQQMLKKMKVVNIQVRIWVKMQALVDWILIKAQHKVPFQDSH